MRWKSLITLSEMEMISTGQEDNLVEGLGEGPTEITNTLLALAAV